MHRRARVLVPLALAGCAARGDATEVTHAPVHAAPRVGQWIWTRADLAPFDEGVRARADMEAGVYIGAVRCDVRTHRLVPQAGLPASAAGGRAATVVIRLEDGLDQCRTPVDTTQRFDAALDSAVRVLRTRVGATPVAAVQLDHDVPQRALAAWARSVRHLRAHALAGDEVWVTSLVSHLREPGYGELFRDVVAGHVLQVFDTGEPATPARVQEALRLARRARMPFRLGLGAFERRTRAGPTEHRAWFATVRQFAAIDGYRGVWVFPAGHRWITYLGEAG